MLPRITVCLNRSALAVVDQAAKETGLTRPHILEHLASRYGSVDELVSLLKSETVRPKLRGRRKESIHRKLG